MMNVNDWYSSTRSSLSQVVNNAQKLFQTNSESMDEDSRKIIRKEALERIAAVKDDTEKFRSALTGHYEMIIDSVNNVTKALRCTKNALEMNEDGSCLDASSLNTINEVVESFKTKPWVHELMTNTHDTDHKSEIELKDELKSLSNQLSHHFKSIKNRQMEQMNKSDLLLEKSQNIIRLLCSMDTLVSLKNDNFKFDSKYRKHSNVDNTYESSKVVSSSDMDCGHHNPNSTSIPSPNPPNSSVVSPQTNLLKIRQQIKLQLEMLKPIPNVEQLQMAYEYDPICPILFEVVSLLEHGLPNHVDALYVPTLEKSCAPRSMLYNSNEVSLPLDRSEPQSFNFSFPWNETDEEYSCESRGRIKFHFKCKEGHKSIGDHVQSMEVWVHKERKTGSKQLYIFGQDFSPFIRSIDHTRQMITFGIPDTDIVTKTEFRYWIRARKSLRLDYGFKNLMADPWIRWKETKSEREELKKIRKKSATPENTSSAKRAKVEQESHALITAPWLRQNPSPSLDDQLSHKRVTRSNDYDEDQSMYQRQLCGNAIVEYVEPPPPTPSPKMHDRTNYYEQTQRPRGSRERYNRSERNDSDKSMSKKKNRKLSRRSHNMALFNCVEELPPDSNSTSRRNFDWNTRRPVDNSPSYA